MGVRQNRFKEEEFLPDRRPLKSKVYLVGAGPGDPDLLTVKAVRILGLATVVLHDALVSKQVLTLISPAAQVISVAKPCGPKSITQTEINQLLVRHAMSGEIVVRLKSGDPLIFGRAGEELEFLRRAGVDIEIVPGITASLAAAAKMKLSLTDRRRADQVLFISGHRERGKADLEWHSVVNRRTTVVVYMPGQYAGIAEHLHRRGLSGFTPCAVVSRVSTPEEQWYQTTLDALDGGPVLPGPCVLIVGEIVDTTASRQEPLTDLRESPGRGNVRTPLGLNFEDFLSSGEEPQV
jgi:uroporphyrin-III C-methyltransferase